MRKYLTCGLVALAAGRAAAGTADPLDKPFSATPAQLLAAAQKLTANDDPVIVLRDDTTITYDDQGRATRRYYVVALIEKPAAIDGWGTYDLNWSPFYQDKPTFRARVIAPDGNVAELDPSLITDSPVVSESPSVFSDRREIQAPLPRLSVGAVIEEEIALADHEPLLAAGEVEQAYVGRPIAVQHSVITVSAPSARALHVQARGFAKAPSPRKSTTGGRTTWVYDFGPMAGAPHDFTGIPADVAEWPYIGVATGASWTAIAKGYRALVDERMKDAVPLPDGVRGATPRETVDHVVAWLHAHVRYTGIELRDSAIIPFAPAETSARGFGDCKDKATLLVALLRSAGIHADLAVLSTGPGTDLDRDLPGLGVFDHAIVRAQLDGKDLWIDATEQDLPAGQLPARDQGRLALIVADDTRGLVTTPIAVPADNLIREVRTYHVAEEARSTATERSIEHGVFWDNLRAWARDTSRADITKSLTSYAHDAYGGKLASFSDNKPADITKPFELTVELDDVDRVDTEREQVDAYLRRSATLAHLPDVFTVDDEETAANVKTRTIDYLWTVPHVYEIENRLELPPGFTPPQLTPREQLALGTMTLTTTRTIDHDALVITYRLDTGKRRITAAELAAGRAAVLELKKGNAEHVLIPLASAELAHQGKYPEAIAEAQRVIKLHPTHAIHYDQLSSVYLRTGMGAAARRAAQQAVQVEPTSGDAYDELAWVLHKDTAGHELGFDADRKAALAAYKQALTLKPDHVGAILDYASLLGVDERGAPTSDAADRRQAIAVLRKGKSLDIGDDFDRPLVEALIADGQYADAETAAKALPESEHTTELRVTIAAVLHGAKDAIALADSTTSGAARTRVVAGAGQRLMTRREYDALRGLVAEVGNGKSASAAAGIVAKLARVDVAKLGANDPKRVTILAVLITGGATVANPPWDAIMNKGLVAARGHAGTRGLATMAANLVADVSAAMATVTPYDHDGWKVTLESGGHYGAFYVALDHGHALLVGSNDTPAGLGRYALALLARKDDAGAARWIEREVVELEQAGASAKAWTDVTKLYRDELARAGGKAAPTALVERVAAMFAAGEDLAHSEPVLRRCAASDEPGHDLCARHLLGAFILAERWKDAAELAPRVTTPTDEPPILVDLALTHAGKPADAAKLLDAYLAAHPDDVVALYARARAAIQLGTWKDAQPYLDKITAVRDVSTVVLNDIAWLHLVYDADPAVGADLAHRAEKQVHGATGPGLDNTIALAEVETGDLAGAWKHLDAAIDAHARSEPSPGDWYVLGRLAEIYALRDDAIADYQRALADKRNELPDAAGDLAQQRLDALRKH
jgi:tetratricopeptide (TPR) repeat protein